MWLPLGMPYGLESSPLELPICRVVTQRGFASFSDAQPPCVGSYEGLELQLRSPT